MIPQRMLVIFLWLYPVIVTADTNLNDIAMLRDLLKGFKEESKFSDISELNEKLKYSSYGNNEQSMQKETPSDMYASKALMSEMAVDQLKDTVFKEGNDNAMKLIENESLIQAGKIAPVFNGMTANDWWKKMIEIQHNKTIIVVTEEDECKSAGNYIRSWLTDIGAARTDIILVALDTPHGFMATDPEVIRLMRDIREELFKTSHTREYPMIFMAASYIGKTVDDMKKIVKKTHGTTKDKKRRKYSYSDIRTAVIGLEPKDLLDAITDNNPFVIFGKPTCAFCDFIKQDLRTMDPSGSLYKFINLSDPDNFKDIYHPSMPAETKMAIFAKYLFVRYEQSKIPMVIINGELLGGYSEFSEIACESYPPTSRVGKKLVVVKQENDSFISIMKSSKHAASLCGADRGTFRYFLIAALKKMMIQKHRKRAQPDPPNIEQTICGSVPQWVHALNGDAQYELGLKRQPYDDKEEEEERIKKEKQRKAKQKLDRLNKKQKS